MKDFSVENIKRIYFSPLNKLVEEAHKIHKIYFDPTKIQASQLLSIKTGGCSENCSYCSQSAHYQTGVQKEKLLPLEKVIEKAKLAKKNGASRFCMGAAWKEVRDGPQFDRILEMVKAINDLDLEVCCTLGGLNLEQAKKLKANGLYAYNHNIDTSKEFYQKIVSTHSYEDRIKTLECVRKAGITVCTGGILGLGENHEDRVSFLQALSSFDPQPESVTINTLVPIKGTPLESAKPVSSLEVIQVIATARILMPKSFIRLSAGRKNMKESEQFLAFYSGANSIFLGEKLLTTDNPTKNQDLNMLKSMGMSLVTHQKESLR